MIWMGMESTQSMFVLVPRCGAHSAVPAQTARTGVFILFYLLFSPPHFPRLLSLILKCRCRRCRSRLLRKHQHRTIRRRRSRSCAVAAYFRSQQARIRRGGASLSAPLHSCCQVRLPLLTEVLPFLIDAVLLFPLLFISSKLLKIHAASD